MAGIKIQHTAEDLRPAFFVEDIDGADFGRIKVAVMAGVPTFAVRNVKNFSVYRSKPVPDTELASADQREI
jgi:hypothetical protein